MIATYLFLFAFSAVAKPLPVVTGCPWVGVPRIDAISGDRVVVNGVEYRVGSGKNRLFFINVLNACNAGAAVPALVAWQQGQAAMTVKGIEAASAAVSYAAQIEQATTGAERKRLVAAAATDAANFVAHIAALEATTKGALDELMMTLAVSAAPTAAPTAD